MSEPTSAWLVVRNVHKSFAGTEILHGVDLNLARGSVHALVGHNGAGKSTLIKVLAGMYPDHTGDISISGRPLRLESPRDSASAGIAVIHQDFSLVPEFTAAENMFLGREPQRPRGVVRHRQMEHDAARLLRRFGLDVPLGVPVGRLSVAHQQLTEIAKALAAGAKILIMDEPTSRLAPNERASLFSIIRQLTAEGVGVIYVSHFLKEVLDIADVVTVLRNGAVVETGAADAFTVDRLAQQIVGEAAMSERVSREGAVQRRPALELRSLGPRGRPGSDLVVHTGEVVGIAGLVGSGRTSLLEAIAGARPASGGLFLFGEEVRFRTPAQATARGVVLVPEDRKTRGLVMRQPLAENIVLSALSKQFSSFGVVRRGAVQTSASKAVERFRILANDPRAPVAGLSGGNQQKVLLARATETAPTVLLFDQPTAGVDIGAKQEIYGHIDRLAAQGVACLVTSDEIEELLAICDRIAIMRNGRLDPATLTSQLDEQKLLARMSVTEEGAA